MLPRRAPAAEGPRARRTRRAAMDRRGFLRQSGAVAATAAASLSRGLGEGARAGGGPAARRLGLAVAPGDELAGFGAERLARRLELAMAGRLIIERVADAAASDLSFGDARRHLTLQDRK